MHWRRWGAGMLLGVAGVAGVACSSEPRARRVRAETAAPVDSARGELQVRFQAPETWELVSNPSGLRFRQPPGFTVGLNVARVGSCDSATPAADSAIFDKTFLERWPLTLAMRRGDVNQIARANGFTLDSTDVATHESSGAGTTLKTGEGWLLLSGETASRVSVLFASVRHPAGCNLIWAARGADLDADTLGMVLATVRFENP